MAWLQVVLDELAEMSRRFHSGSTEYEQTADGLKMSAPDSGDGRLTSLIDSSLQVMDVLNRQVAGEIEKNSQLIDAAKTSYERRDIDNRQLFDDLIKDK
ncbi:hypothetical protein FZI91_21410 [Mycobacterium sp. CBMA271]|uniref:DUF6317 family protein n=1 Tax=unclassified Mycobacteroides TaxID=2618759 RepID=UPI0012DFC171|nr:MULTISPECIES: DUF6317 family protein [unclassified Mycobacteroides]MUM24244.1 hypothetical protein [Mycobacteroides sp. CBMA 271]